MYCRFASRLTAECELGEARVLGALPRTSSSGVTPKWTNGLGQLFQVSRAIDPSDCTPKEFIVQSSDQEISRFSQQFLAVSKMFTTVVLGVELEFLHLDQLVRLAVLRIRGGGVLAEAGVLAIALSARSQ